MKSLSWNKECQRSMRSNPIGMRPNRCHAEVRQERQEIREYLDKLRQLVPACPKDGKMSRLAVIQYVIDYIVELQDTLVHHPVNNILGNEDIADLASIHSNPIFSLQALNTSKNPSSPTEPGVTNVVLSNKNDNGPSDKVISATLNHSSSNKKNKTSSSTCRRPLGVLSSFKNHRNL